MKGLWWRVPLCMLLTLGGVFFWKYSGADSAIKAQREISKNGWHYIGAVTLSNEDYYSLKADLAKRDGSLQTGVDLVIKQINLDGSIDVSYNFYTVADYLDLYREKPKGNFAVGFAVVPFIGPALYFIMLLLLLMKILNPLPKEVKNAQGPH